MDPEEGAASPDGMRIDVERTGGIAGIPRRWSASAEAGDAAWQALVDRCPWPSAEQSAATAAPDVGADRFCFTVHVCQGPRHREVTLAEHEVTGPWRTLVDAVRTGSALVEDGEE